MAERELRHDGSDLGDLVAQFVILRRIDAICPGTDDGNGESVRRQGAAVGGSGTTEPVAVTTPPRRRLRPPG